MSLKTEKRISPVDCFFMSLKTEKRISPVDRFFTSLEIEERAESIRNLQKIIDKQMKTRYNSENLKTFN